MATEFENNLNWVGLALLAASILWMLIGRVQKPAICRIVRASILFLIFPLVYLGHPVFFYQVWMLLPIYFSESDFLGMSILFVIWAIVLIISLKLKGSGSN